MKMSILGLSKVPTTYFHGQNSQLKKENTTFIEKIGGVVNTTVVFIKTYIPHPKARNMGQFKRQLNQVDNTRNILI